MLLYELVSDIFDALLLALACQYGAEEEETQEGKEDDHLQQNKPPKGASPGHRPEAVAIELPNGNYPLFHLEGLNYTNIFKSPSNI